MFFLYVLGIALDYTIHPKKKLSKILETIEIVRENLYNNVNFQLSIEKIFITILR